MGTAVVSQEQAQALEQVLIGGDLARLKPEDRILYYKQVCESVGLNPVTKPFEYINLNGKLTLYALRSCTEQLRKIHGVSIIIAAREVVEDCYIVTARATDAKGRHDESIGAVPISKLTGEARSNAMMKAETKAKRRVTLSICGLGMLDESEADSIPGAYPSPTGSTSATAGYLAKLTAERQEVMHETALQVKEHWANDRILDGYSLIENSGFDAEEMIALWSLLPSNIRAAHKRMKESENAADKGTISPAQKKRLEATIKDFGLDRNEVKAECVKRWGIEHFTELTKEQYKELDAAIVEMSDAKLNAAARPLSPPAASPSAETTGAAAAPYISAEQESTLIDLLEANGISLKTFLQFGKLTALAKLPADRYEKAKQWIATNKVTK